MFIKFGNFIIEFFTNIIFYFYPKIIANGGKFRFTTTLASIFTGNIFVLDIYDSADNFGGNKK